MSNANEQSAASPTPSSSTVSLIPSRQNPKPATGRKDYAAAFGQLSSTYGYGTPMLQTTIPSSASPIPRSRPAPSQASAADSKAERKSLPSRLLGSVSRSSSKYTKVPQHAHSSTSVAEASVSADSASSASTTATSSFGSKGKDNGDKGGAKESDAARKSTKKSH